MDYEHDRFLYEKDGNLHFGCVNPFCGHGNPALPNHYRVPMETDTMTLKFISHKNRQVTLEAADNLKACEEEFNKVFNPDKPRTLPRFI